ncbi:MAG: T9SS type A sorting domain-containing protein [Caldisericaceae bacterium]|nr:T9SS type A sorting domain-containing protein [Caldisericaceae bacterium]
MLKKFFFVMLIFLFSISVVLAQTEWQSKLVYYGPDGRLHYERDGEGNIIPDFSWAGYKNGQQPIPDVPVVVEIEPVAGDNTSHIQQAIDSVAQMEPDSTGFRGAIQLKAGLYEVYGTIYLNKSGIVLRGVGDGEDPASNTIIYAKGNSPNQRSVIVAGGGDDSKWREMVPGTKSYIMNDTVLVGSRSFRVQKPNYYNVGDNIIIYHPCTEEWLQAIDWGGTHSNESGAEPGVDEPWEIGSQPIVYNRYISKIEGDQITIDAPVYNTLVRSLSKSYVYTYMRHKLETHIGIENLRVDIETKGGDDEAHAWNSIDLFLIEDAWVRNCTAIHFGEAGFRTNTATRVTIENCKALDPVSKITGGRRYNFEAYTASQLILFKNCLATNGRHHYMSNGTTWTSGIVFLDCQSSGAYASSEGHRRWSQGLLYDNLIELDGPRPGYNPRLLGLYCRGYYGTSHGWSAAHSVAWNCDVAQGDLIVQKPPTAQNYAIGCKGKNITGKKPPASFDEPEGYIEGSNQDGLKPRSLYLAQFEDRMLATGLKEFKNNRNLPNDLQLLSAFPNPFNQQVRIQFKLQRTSAVTIRFYTVLGQLVQQVELGRLTAGSHFFLWRAADSRQQALSSGLYLVSVSTDRGSQQNLKLISVR